MIRRPPRSTLDRSSAASDVYKRQALAKHPHDLGDHVTGAAHDHGIAAMQVEAFDLVHVVQGLSLIHISEPTRPY